MTPVLLTLPRTSTPACSDLLLAAGIVRDAAQALAEEALDSFDAARYHSLANRLARVLESPRAGRQRLLLTSPALTERSGRNRTLIDMLEDDPGDAAARLRLAKLLLRALVWRPETFPMPSA